MYIKVNLSVKKNTILVNEINPNKLKIRMMSIKLTNFYRF